ncbi:MAG: Trk system potassium transporter TrkA [Erysipelotrichaceae bacterium]|nr:Trk system potassium transporter TrkA [Erysipelotrichaceae bacterium]
MKIVIVGDGKLGILLTQILSEDDHDITVIDSNPKVLMHNEGEFDTISIKGHGASIEVLKNAGVDNADILIAATSSDEVNLLSSLFAKNMGCKNTIARVRNTEYSSQINLLRDELGLSFIINPDEICAREILGLLQFPSFLEREYFASGLVEIVRITISKDSPLKNMALVDIQKVTKVKALVCAVERDGQVTVPSGDFVIFEHDDIFITTNNSSFLQLIKELKLSTQKVKNVVIVGGSRIALYLANKLHKIKINVKIIENNHKRCTELVELLPFADIVEADGTDYNILSAEGVFQSDALVSLINIDEENILLSVIGKQGGIPKTITKCNRTQYIDIFKKMGVDTLISPKLTSAFEIVRYIRGMEQSTGSEMLTMCKIANGKAEALEFRVKEHSIIVGKTLAELNFKKNTLIASIIRGKEIILPSGSTIIYPNDFIVVVTSNLNIIHLEEILETSDRS